MSYEWKHAKAFDSQLFFRFDENFQGNHDTGFKRLWHENGANVLHSEPWFKPGNSEYILV